MKTVNVKRKFSKLVSMGLLCSTACFNLNIFAEGIPVHDDQTASVLSEKLNELLNQLNLQTGFARDDSITQKSHGDKFDKQIENQASIIEKLSSIYGAMTQPKGYSGITEGALQRASYAPDNWTEVASKILNRGDSIGNLSAYAEHTDEYSSRYNVIAGSNAYATFPENRNSLFHDDSTQTTYAAYNISEAAYNQTTKRNEVLDKLYKEIENTPDIKASIDLSNLINTENGFAIAEIIRLQSVLIQLQANLLQRENNTVSNEATLIKYEY